jgi:hypothetical protein
MTPAPPWWQTTTDMPAALAARPRDERRGLPIPFTSDIPDGGHDFTTIDARRIVQCVTGKLCALCGEPLGYWLAFIGGQNAADNRAYTDPPGHPDCMRWAITLCPFIAMRRYKRAPEHRHEGKDIATAEGFHHPHPDRWGLAITRAYKAGPDRHGVMVFRPAPFKDITWYHYGPDGQITQECQQCKNFPMRDQCVCGPVTEPKETP